MATTKNNTSTNTKSVKDESAVSVAARVPAEYAQLIDEASITDEELASRLRGDVDPGYVYYFAYDEDVDERQMETLCPSAERIVFGSTVIRNRCFAVGEGGRATLEKGYRDLDGILWAVSRKDAEALVEHRYQWGYELVLEETEFELRPVNRRKRKMEVFPVKAMVFVTRGENRELDEGNKGVFETVVGMRRKHCLKVEEELTKILELAGVRPLPTTTIDRYLDYVCNECFLPLGECACYMGGNNYLIQVDHGIQHAVHVLNLKGYTTRYSCEGHPAGTYLMFTNGDRMPDAEPPEGFYWKSLCLYSDCPKKASREELEELKKQHLETLNAWCDGLPMCKTPKYHICY